jgi:hypothetical protein
VQKQIALCAALLGAGLFATSAQAQPQPVTPYYPGTAYPGAMYPGGGPALPPYEILTIVRSTGLEPLSRPLRQGPAYVLRAVDPSGQEMRVIADARTGRLVKVVPVAGARYVGPMTPPPYGQPAARTAPDGYGANSRIAGVPPGTEVAPGAAAPPPAVQAGPPLPRPRPKIAVAEQPAPAPATAATPQAVPAQAAPAQASPAPAAEAKETTGAISPPKPSAPAADDQAE